LTCHLVIPDSHATPGHHNRRFTWLGHLINDVKPDVVIDIGDWFSMDSLCSYDKGKKSFEGRRYIKDIQAGLEAQDRMRSVIDKQKRKLPRFVRTLGNHEQRIVKAIEQDAVLEGTIGLKDLQSREYGWEEYPFLEQIDIDGISYAHYFVSGVMGRPISGFNAASQLITKQLKSCTCGHSHLFDYAIRTDAVGRKLHGLVSGVYQDYYADYAGPANLLWNAGVCIKRGVENGRYDLEHISLARIKEAYQNL
jgi:Calcineurin-like phosphoesterase